MYGTRSPLLKLGLVLVVLAAVVFFVRLKKDALVREGAVFLQDMLSRETKLGVHIGKISGKVTGAICFEDVTLEDPGLPEGLRVLFRAKRVEFRYRLWEFLTKNFQARIIVNVTDPELYWRPNMELRNDSPPFFYGLRDLLLTQRERLSLHVKNLTLFTGSQGLMIPGIGMEYESDRFRVDVPLRHFHFGENDISAELKWRGRFEWGLLRADDKLVGEMYTEGSVVNTQPLPWESRFNFTLTREGLRLDNSTFLGGFQLTGEAHFADNDTADFSLSAHEYPIKNLELFLERGEPNAYDGQLSLQARFHGPLDQLMTEVNARLDGGRLGSGHFRSMTLHASGVYPTLTLSDSHLLMEDGTQMRFADQTVEFRQLFSSRTYRSLITGTSQDNVSLGEWGFRRPIDENQNSEFLMERSLGEHARVQLRKYNETELDRRVLEPAEQSDRQDVEVGLELHLRPEDKLKYTMREDEQFVGVERKLSF